MAPFLFLLESGNDDPCRSFNDGKLHGNALSGNMHHDHDSEHGDKCHEHYEHTESIPLFLHKPFHEGNSFSIENDRVVGRNVPTPMA